LTVYFFSILIPFYALSFSNIENQRKTNELRYYRTHIPQILHVSMVEYSLE